jgi:hypothetical protein
LRGEQMERISRWSDLMVRFDFQMIIVNCFFLVKVVSDSVTGLRSSLFFGTQTHAFVWTFAQCPNIWPKGIQCKQKTFRIILISWHSNCVDSFPKILAKLHR